MQDLSHGVRQTLGYKRKRPIRHQTVNAREIIHRSGDVSERRVVWREGTITTPRVKVSDMARLAVNKRKGKLRSE